MWCKKCNRETEEKKCSVCGAVTEEDIPFELYWCDNCKVPIIKAVNGADREHCPLCGGKTRYAVLRIVNRRLSFLRWLQIWCVCVPRFQSV